jgi:hypothetical protein
MAKIYLAAQTRRRTEMAKIGRALEKAGHTITSLWVFEDDHTLDRKIIAQRDIDHVAAADTVVLFTEPRKKKQIEHGGRHFESALGLAWNKHLIIVGPPENVFHHLDSVVCLDSVQKNAKTPEERKAIQDQIQQIVADMRFETAVLKRRHVLDYLRGLTEKTLVFGWHVDVMIEPLAKALSEEGRGVVVVTGKTGRAQAEARRKQFQKDPDCQFYISNMKTAVGINLTAASRVVFAEVDWVPSVEDQASDRPHRHGQTKKVRCVRLLYGSGTDHWLTRVSKDKRNMTERALNLAVAEEIVKESEKQKPDDETPPPPTLQ